MSHVAVSNFSTTQLIMEDMIKVVLLRIGAKMRIALLQAFKKTLPLVDIGKKIDKVFLRDSLNIQKIAKLGIRIPGKWQNFFRHPHRTHSPSCNRINDAGGNS